MPKYILNADYVSIVRQFEKKIFENLSDKLQESIGNDPERVWELAGKSLDSSEIFGKFFPRVDLADVAVNHLTRKLKEKSSEKYLPIRQVYLVNILLHIGIAYRVNVLPSEIDTIKKRADHLYDVYKGKTEVKKKSMII